MQFGKLQFPMKFEVVSGFQATPGTYRTYGAGSVPIVRCCKHIALMGRVFALSPRFTRSALEWISGYDSGV